MAELMNLKQYRKKFLKLSQGEVGMALGVAIPYVSLVENGLRVTDFGLMAGFVAEYRLGTKERFEAFQRGEGTIEETPAPEVPSEATGGKLPLPVAHGKDGVPPLAHEESAA